MKLPFSSPHSSSSPSQEASTASVLGLPGAFLISRALTSCTSRPAASSRWNQIRHVVTGGFQGNLLDPLTRQVLTQLQDRIRSGIHIPDPGPPRPGPRRMRPPRAHLPRRFSHVNRADPPQDLLVLLVLDFLGFPHHRDPLLTQAGKASGMPRGLGDRKSTRLNSSHLG